MIPLFKGHGQCALSTVLCSLALLFLISVASGEEDQGHCHVNKYVYEKNANARFALILSLRKDDTSLATSHKTCSLLSREPLQNVLAVEWILDRLNKANNGNGYMNNVTLGFDSHDDCRSPVYASRNALSFVDTWLPDAIATCTQDMDNTLHFGIVGPSRSSTAIRVAYMFRDFKMPIVSMSASAAELSNKLLYPTFLRTVPSDVHQMTFIADILQKLQWTYVVVIYEEDEYGISANTILREKARERGICVHKSLPLPTDFLNELARELENVLLTAKDYSLGVVFIGSRDKAEQFLWVIDRSPDNQPKYGLHFIFTDAVNVDTTVFDHKEFGQGSLTIGPSGVFLADLYADLQTKWENVKAGRERHELIEKYIKENPNRPLLDPNSLDSFVPLTIHAVMGQVQSLKLLQKKVCKGQAGICPELIQTVEKGDLLSGLFNLSLEYNQLARGVPPNAFIDRNITLSFDSNGNMELINHVPSYTAYQFNMKEFKYSPVGSYVDGVTYFNVSELNMLKPYGSPSKKVPTSVCKDRCDAVCPVESTQQITPMAYIPGDAYIMAILSQHDRDSLDPFSCGNFRTNDAVIVEGFLYAVRQLREMTGINFGGVVLDDCYSSLRPTSLLSDFFSGLVDDDAGLFPFHFPREKLVGVVACRSSTCTIPVASFFMPLKVPVVSFAASSPDLDDKVVFPYFLRTVPSDVAQARVMLQIVQTMGWEYVGLLYVRNNYGTKGMQAFKAQAMQESSGVCVASEVGISENESDMDATEFFQVWKTLYNQEVKVVIFFGIDSRYRAFLRYLEKHSLYGKFIFLGSEDWGNTMAILQSGPKASRGSITLKVESMELEDADSFKNLLRTKVPSANDENVWFKEFWQAHFQCNFKGGFINQYNRECTSAMKLTEEDVQRYSQDQRVVHIMNAVYALGKGIMVAKNKLCESAFPCKFLQQYVQDVVASIRDQTRKEGSLDQNVFDSDGNGDIGFDIYNVQQVNNKPIYVKVGTFNSKEQILQKENLKFYSDTGNEIKTIDAKCTDFLCAHCPKPASVNPTPGAQVVEGVDCEINDFRTSDILIISLVIVLILAVLVGIAVLVLCCTRKYNVLSKKLDQKEDLIYAEPETRIYQGDYLQTNGITFANLGDDPYRHLEQRGPVTLGRPPVHRGLSNPAFVNDRVDSVSQILQPDALSFRSQPADFRSRVNTSSGVGALSRFSAPTTQSAGRTIPVSFIGSEHRLSYMHDNPAFMSSSTENALNSRSGPGTSLPSSTILSNSIDGTAAISQASGPPSILKLPGTSLPTTMIGAGTAQASTPSGLSETGVMYYVQGPDGQLTAQISPQAIPMSQMYQNGLSSPPGMVAVTSASRSDGSSSSVNPDHGPYSFALAQRQYQAGAPSQSRAATPSSEIDAPVTYVVDPQGIELQTMMGPALHQPTAQAMSQHVSEQPIENSPVQYASPSRNVDRQNSTEDELQERHLQQQQLQQLRQQQLDQQYLQQLQIEQREEELQLRQQQQQLRLHAPHPQGVESMQGLPPPTQSPPPQRSLQSPTDNATGSMSSNGLNASIPDIVGQLSGQVDIGPMESVDLNSRDTTDGQEPQVKIRTDGKAKFQALAAMGGNISRV